MDEILEQLKTRLKDPNRYKDAAEQTRQAEQVLGKGAFGYSSVIPPPATLEQIEMAEQELGFHLPRLLRQIYSQIANGGFGPGYGLLGLPPNGGTDDQGNTALSLSLAIPDPDNPDEYYWPDGLMPICYYGCNIYACLDCTEEDGSVYKWDAEELEHLSTSLQEWFEDWLT